MEEVYAKQNGITETEDAETMPANLEDAQVNALSALAATAADLSRAVSKIAAYVPTQWVDNSEPSINSTRLMHIENGIRDATAAVNSAIDAITDINGSFEIAGDTKHLRLATQYDTDVINFRQVTNDKNFLQLRTDSNHSLILEKMVNNSDTVLLAEYAKRGEIPSGIYDLDNPPAYHMFEALAGSKNIPADIGGNSVFVLQLLPFNPVYGAMLIFGFGSQNRIGLRRKFNSETWSEWHYVSLT